MGVVYNYLGFSRKCNVAMLDNPNDFPGVVDGDRKLGENGIYYQV